MPYINGVGDVITQPLYDELVVTAAATPTQLVFFSQPVGQGVPAKTLLNTNMALAGQLQVGFSMKVMAISVSFRNSVTLANAKAILDGGFMQLNVGPKWWWQAPLGFTPGGKGIFGFSDLGAATPGNENVTNGMPDTRAVYTLRQHVDILPTESFNVTVTWPVAPTVTADTPLMLVLHGELTRTVG